MRKAMVTNTHQGGQPRPLVMGIEDKDKRLQELQKECDSLKQDLKSREEDVADLRKRWVKTAKELDKFRATSQGFYQITDEYLVGQIDHLRLIIRDFSIQYFDGRFSPRYEFPFQPHYLRHLKAISEQNYHDYISSPAHCHKAIQAFIWHVIVEEVFGKFAWLGQEDSNHLYQVWLRLQPPRNFSSEGCLSPPDPEAERRFQTWRATTTALFLQNINAEKSDNYIKHRASQHAQGIMNTLRTLIKKEEADGLRDQLAAVIHQAFMLDCDISHQPGHVMWRFRAVNLQETSAHTQKHGDSALVISPAVLKRGKSTGEDFDHVNQLLEAEIDCRGQV